MWYYWSPTHHKWWQRLEPSRGLLPQPAPEYSHGLTAEHSSGFIIAICYRCAQPIAWSSETGPNLGQQVKPEINIYITDYGEGGGNICLLQSFTRTSKWASEVIYDNHHGWDLVPVAFTSYWGTQAQRRFRNFKEWLLTRIKRWFFFLAIVWNEWVALSCCLFLSGNLFFSCLGDDNKIRAWLPPEIW